MPPAAGNPAELLADRTILAGTGPVPAPPPPDRLLDEGPDEFRALTGSQPQSPAKVPSPPAIGLVARGGVAATIDPAWTLREAASPSTMFPRSEHSLSASALTHSVPAAARRVPRAPLLSEGGSQSPCRSCAAPASSAHAEHGGLHFPSHAMSSTGCKAGKKPGPVGRSVGALALLRLVDRPLV